MINFHGASLQQQCLFLAPHLEQWTWRMQVAAGLWSINQNDLFADLSCKMYQVIVYSPGKEISKQKYINSA